MAATAAFKKIILEKGPKVLETSFAKDLSNGNLSPRRLGVFMIQDIVCLENKKRYVDTACDKTDLDGAPAVRNMLRNKSADLESSKETLFKEWHIRNSHGIALSDQFDKYVHNFGQISNNTSFQALTALAGREYLWNWMAGQINAKQENSGVYKDWIDNHLAKSGATYAETVAMIDTQIKDGKMFENVTSDFFSKSIDNEASLFETSFEDDEKILLNDF